MTPEINVVLQNPYGFNVIPAQSQLQKWVNAAYQGSITNHAEIVIRVVDIAESKNLNANYRQKDTATNVLSFASEMPQVMQEISELQQEDRHLGDLVVCEPVVNKEANQQGKSLEAHWAHLIVHGTLHLQGYDHIEDAAADEMETLEINVLRELGFENPY